MIEKVKEARVFYQRKIMRTYIWSKLKALTDFKVSKNIKADDFRLKCIKKSGFQKLRHASEILTYQSELQIQKMSKTAYTFNDFNLQMKVVQALTNHV